MTGQPFRWALFEDNQFELWPIPNAATVVRFRTMKKLPPMVAGTDKCTIDGTLIVLAAAAETLARMKSDDASIKLQVATAHYNRLKGRYQKNRVFVLGGGVAPVRRRDAFAPRA